MAADSNAKAVANWERMAAESGNKPAGPELHLGDFSGPLDLLLYLIEKDQIDIYDIPISSLTDQYLDYMKQTDQLDMESASRFLVMAATLLQLKSRLLLPLQQAADDDDGEDPRQELVLQLLAYRRARLVAAELERRENYYGDSVFRLPAAPAELGITVTSETGPGLDPSAFEAACSSLTEQNAERFADLKDKLTHLLGREKVSMRDRVIFIWRSLRKRGKALFSELFPNRRSKTERVTGFLGLLELMKHNQVNAVQAYPLAAIELELTEEAATTSEQIVDTLFGDRTGATDE